MAEERVKTGTILLSVNSKKITLELFPADAWPAQNTGDDLYRVRIDGRWYCALGKYTFLTLAAVGELVASLLAGGVPVEPEALPEWIECLRALEKQLIAHAEPVLKCTPGLKDHPKQLAAAVSLAYNIGPNAYCRSTVAKRFNAGDWAGACAAFEMWNRAGGKVLKGLVRRRADERRLCETDLPLAAEVRP